MNDPITRTQLLRRAAGAGAALSLSGLFAACGGGGGPEMTVSNWILYIDDVDGRHPTLDQFTKETGIKVNYIEDIDSNEQFFGKIQAPLSQGKSIDRDVVTPTAWMCARLLRLGYLQKLDRSIIPNAVNLEDSLAHPTRDPDREYGLPWQTYMTGIGYDVEKVGFEITKVSDLLDPKLKGRVTLLDSVEDTIGLFLLEMGSDPTKVDKAAFDEALATVQKAVDDGQIRQLLGNSYTGPLSKGDTWASIAYSGDVISLQATNPNLKFVIPEAGGMTSVDTMVIPLGGDVHAASTYMNFYYRPEIMAQVEASITYIPPVKGVREAILDIDPSLADNPLIFPAPEIRSILHEYDPEALENPELQKKWQAVIGA